METDIMTNYEKIQARIDTNPTLAIYADLLQYDWEDEDEHADWVATAPVSEIVEWAQQIRETEQGQIDAEAIQDSANW
jgi:uncharacterized membrane protein